MSEKKTGGYGFYKVAACTFPISIGDVKANIDKICEIVTDLDKKGVQLAVFPELCITGYTCGDMFLRKELTTQAEYALRDLLATTSRTRILVCVGMPIEEHGKLFNCAVYIQAGQIKGVVPKTYIPNYGEYYEKRWFVSSTCRTSETVNLCGYIVPFSENLLLNGEDDIIIATEICEDLWTDSPPSGLLSRAGATVIVNPSASNDIIGKTSYRRNLVKMQSGRCRSGYVYASCGEGESTTDLVFSGHCIIADNGHIINEDKDNIVIGVIDIERCVNDRRKYNSDVWGKAPEVVEVPVFTSAYPVILPDKVNPYPFVPSNVDDRSNRCMEILNLQVKGLSQRLKVTGLKPVIGVSGGLDSTLALLVCCIAMDRLNLSREDIIAVTMPCFGTSDKTLNLAKNLCEALNVNLTTIDISKSVKQHLKDFGHELDNYDISYENAQARERTQVLFDLANMSNGLVVGTGDMSELALGWCTYNGDHMSNYAVNCGIPKTLVKFIVRTYASECSNDGLRKVLFDICDLPYSPELVPQDDKNNMQSTEGSIGKYDLHDFFLYHFLRNGFSRDKILVLAEIAFNHISRHEIVNTLDVFYKRFRTQQFKRSCMPDGVKVGTVALSPRGDLRMPSDMSNLY